MKKTLGVFACMCALACAGGEETVKVPEYAPLVPKVEWEKLNWLQKTTASIAIVPGCVFSSLYNTYIWATNWK